MSLKRGFKFTVIFLLVCLVTLLFATLFLPKYIESHLLPKFTSQTELPSIQGKIKRISLTGIDIENIILGIPESPFLSADSLAIEYSLGTLRHRHIEKISIAGVSLNCTLINGKLILQDYSSPVNTQNSAPEKATLPFSLGQFTVRNSLINFRYNGQLLKIPFDLLVEQSAPRKFNSRLTLFPRDQKLVVHSDVDLASNLGIIKLSATSFILERFIDLINLPAKINLTSNLNIISSTTIQISPFQLQQISASIKGTVAVAMPDIESFASGLNLKGNISIAGAYSADLNTPFTLDIMTHITDTTITDPQHEIVISKINGTLPFVWPLDRSSTKETMVIDSITWKDKTVGSVEISTQQHGSLLQVQGIHTNTLLPGLQLNFKGEYQPAVAGLEKGFTLNFNSDYEAQAVDLSDLYPMAELFFVDGRFKIDGKVGGTFAKPNGTLQLAITDGLVEIPGQDMAIEGIQTTLNLTTLLPLRSEPAQLLHFDTFTLGNISLANGAVTYQVESPPGLLFIEKGSVQWGSGLINTYNLRLTGKQKEFNINLYAEQLSLGEILEQFGVSNAGGEGRVSGRISLKLKEGEIDIRDSFLYSTPGTGGSIRLSGTEIITQGMPVGTLGYSQLDFAAEALKEFKYNWVKLNFANEGKNLVMKMEMDGKPGRRLPFRYDSQNGAFIRIQEKNSAAGIYQPIRLDVNFRLPLNKILEYKKGIDNALDTFQ